jgi:hypothetical protein
MAMHRVAASFISGQACDVACWHETDLAERPDGRTDMPFQRGHFRFGPERTFVDRAIER